MDKLADILQAVLLGIIEGLTEFLPVSSTGHLIIAEEYLAFHDTARVFTVVIQTGAILAVIWFYRLDIWVKLRGLFKNESISKNFWRNLVIASLPAGLLGWRVDEPFQRYATPRVVALALIVGAFVLWWADNFEHRRRPGIEGKSQVDKITLKQALIAGVAQSFALIPGTSRSGASIVGGLLGGMNRVTATAFSFYLAIPILLGAGFYKIINDRHELTNISGGVEALVVGTVVSFIVALAAISWLLKYVSTHSFRLFVYWRILLGILVLVLLV